LTFELFRSPQRKLNTVRNITWIAYLMLLISLLGDGILSGIAWPLLVIVIAPLLIFLPGLYKKDARSLVMLCFVCLLYFTVIVTNLFETDRTIFDFSSLVAVVFLFVGAMMFSRWQRLEFQNTSANRE
jgi:uncharacterized membrane protein